jgi:hypothetical protein
MYSYVRKIKIVASGGMAGMRGMRKYGFGVDQVLQMEVRYVLELSVAWILRGGGGNGKGDDGRVELHLKIFVTFRC